MIRTAVTASVMLISFAGALKAQEKEMRVTFTDARGGYCISYLIDPAVAAELAPAGAALTPAGKGTSVSPFLARVIQDEPQFAAWIPASICIARYGAAAVDGREVARAKPGKAISVITSWVSVAEPLGVSGATALLLSISSDEGRLLRSLQEFGLGAEEKTPMITPGEGDDIQLDLKLEKTKITWVGHPTGDPRVGSTQSMSFGYAGARKSVWSITTTTTPAETHLMVGSFRLEGKDVLAKALRSSPIRAVGPQETGGTAEFVFHRLAGH
ncbi:MAG: hypothetical protein ABIZ70_06560 [Gemmatimonadales bacterium]